MADLPEVMGFILKQVPARELPNARLTKLVYLSDWVHAIRHHEQVSPVRWFFDNYGPFVWDVVDTAKEDTRFVLRYTNTIRGNPKAMIGLRGPGPSDDVLSPEEQESVRHVVRQTKDLNWDAFIQLVYSTYPILTSDRYMPLDLVEKAGEYREQNLAAPA